MRTITPQRKLPVAVKLAQDGAREDGFEEKVGDSGEQSQDESAAGVRKTDSAMTTQISPVRVGGLPLPWPSVEQTTTVGVRG